MSKIKGIPKKKLTSTLLLLKAECLSEHSVMMYQHLDVAYMRERSKEAILMRDYGLALKLLALAAAKEADGPQSPKK